LEGFMTHIGNVYVTNVGRFQATKASEVGV